MKKLILSLTVLTLSLLIPSVQAQSAEEIVTKHIEAKGGADAWKKVKSLYMKTATAMMGMEFPSEVWIESPDKMRNVVSFQGKNIITVMNGNEGWTLNPLMGSTKAESLPESALKDFKEQADMAGPFVDYKTKGHSIESLGSDDLDGTDVFKIKLTEKTGDISTYYIDKESYMILKLESKKMINGQEAEQSMEFSDYRKVDGLSFAFTTNIGAGGQNLATKVSELKVNPSLEGKLFSKPE